ncbi:MAG: BTAD domain-containing putative transcriptional regulator [Negativicutes bacterium]|nr:BTAD domain-containing putative transcriptional regulator [Negativicutes bacterium]
MSELLSSKLSAPYVGTNLLERPRLLQLLKDCGRRSATVIAAPAGYGKTALLAQLAGVVNKPLVWYQLDDYDNDPAVFLQYLVAGLRRHFPDFGSDILRLVSSGDAKPNLRLLAMAVVNSLETKTSADFLLVLDDYHLVTEPVIHGLVQELLLHLPGGIHVMIASRTSPPFPLPRLKLQRKINVIGPEELRFTREEISAFRSKNSATASDTIIESIERKTAGWPAAVRMIGDSPSGFADDILSSSQQEIYDYLTAEVFDQQPEAVRDFLLSTSVLENITAAFCDKLLGRTDSAQVLAFLEKQQLFLIPLAGEEKAYRYHDLFRSFLRTRLGTTGESLLRQAGLLAREAGNLESAIEYFIAAGSYADSIAVIQEAGNQAFASGHWQTVARWLEPLSPEVPAAHPWLALYKAKVEVYRGRLGDAETWVDKATPLFANNGDQTGLAESRLLQARILRSRGHFAESLELLDRMLQEIPEEQRRKRFDLVLERHLCFGMTGHFEESEAALTAAIDAAKQEDNNYVLAYLLEALGGTYWALGKYPEALRSYQLAAGVSPDRLLPSYYMQDFVAIIYHDWGESDRALEHVKRSIAVKENLGLTESLPSAYLQLAIIHSDQREWEQSETYFNKAVRLIRENNGEGFYLAMIMVLWTESLGLQGRWLEARAKYDQAVAELPPQHGVAWSIWGAQTIVHTSGFREGQLFLSAAIAELEQSGYKKGLCHAYAFQAWLYHHEGQTTAAGEYMAKALPLSARLNYQQLYIGRYETLQPILKLALRNGVEAMFIQRILIRLGERALGLLADLADDVDPAVRGRSIAPLSEIGGSRAEKLLRRLAGDPDRDVRLLALLATHRLDGMAGDESQPVDDRHQLQVVTFGPFQAFLRDAEDSAVFWRTKKTHDLLAYLVHQQEPATKERILRDLWPDIDSEKAEVIFHTTMYNLRRGLASLNCKNLIRYSNKRYQLQPGAFSSERQQFQELLAMGMRAGVSGEKTAALLEKAVALYRGDYLEDIDYTWVIPYRENLKQAHIEARLNLARYYQEKQDYRQAMAHLLIIETYDPFMEEAHALLMKTYAGQRDRQALDRHYKKVVSVFKRELGLPPSPALNSLYRKLAGAI